MLCFVLFVSSVANLLVFPLRQYSNPVSVSEPATTDKKTPQNDDEKRPDGNFDAEEGIRQVRPAIPSRVIDQVANEKAVDRFEARP